MLRFLADEDFNNHVVKGVWRRSPTTDIVRVQDVGLDHAKDPVVLAWAAANERILVTHDISTMPGFADQRIEAGQQMPGVIVAPRGLTVAQVIEDLILIAECSREGEWKGRVLYLPL
jgi:predicted nuclease of predicted toxin-antitoxin system